jgi:hypothetical protein
MGLIKKFFGTGGGAAEAKPSGVSPSSMSHFAESQSASSLEKTKSRNAPRRDLVKVVLRETMRKHGIPSDWIECRALSVLTRQHKSGMHVQFLVRKADQQLLPYVHAFQESFWEEVLKLDPLARDWLFSVGWEFYEKAVLGFTDLPGAQSWDTGGDTQSMESDTLPPDISDEPAKEPGPRRVPEHLDDDVATDLQALQALMSAPAELAELPDARPRQHKPR